MGEPETRWEGKRLMTKWLEIMTSISAYYISKIMQNKPLCMVHQILNLISDLKFLLHVY